MSKTKKAEKVSIAEYLTKDKETSAKGDAWGDHDEEHEGGNQGVNEYGYELSDDDEKPKKTSSRQEKPREERKTYEKREERREVPSVSYDQSKLPTEGPYVAYVGNLSFDVSQQAIADFFGDSIIEDIKLINDRETGKFKGFGYVTFYKLEGLKHALSLGGQDLLHRAVKVDISERKDKKPFERTERKPYGDSRREGSGFQKREGFERREEKREVVKTDADVDDNWRRKPTDYVKPVTKEFERPKREEKVYEKREERREEKREYSEPRGERKPLNLAPRSTEKKDESQKKDSNNPFGEGKAWEPKDSVKKLEEKVEKELEERRKKHHGGEHHHGEHHVHDKHVHEKHLHDRDHHDSHGSKKTGGREKDDGFERIKKNEGNRRFDNKKHDDKKPETKEEKKPTSEKKPTNKFDALKEE
jgi:hypothetical protein